MPLPNGYVIDDGGGGVPKGYEVEEESKKEAAIAQPKSTFSFRDHPILAEMFKGSAMPNPEAMAAGPLEGLGLTAAKTIGGKLIKSGSVSDVVGAFSPRIAHVMNLVKRGAKVVNKLGEEVPEVPWEPYKPSPGTASKSRLAPIKYGDSSGAKSAPGFTPPEEPLTPQAEQPGIPGPDQPLRRNPNLVSKSRATSSSSLPSKSKSAPGYTPPKESLTPSATPNTPVPEKPATTVPEMVEKAKKAKAPTSLSKQSYVNYSDVDRYAKNNGMDFEAARRYFTNAGTKVISNYLEAPNGWTRLKI